MKVKKILIVDDDANNRYAIGTFLDSNERIIYDAVDGRDAISKIKQYEPDLLILDYEMPGYNGLEVYTMLRNYLKMQETPVIFCTGKIGYTGLLSSMPDKKIDIILKPCNLASLEDKVVNFLTI